MIDLELYEEMALLARRGEPFALATVIASLGSSPRKAGAKMLIRCDGSALGSIGGGRIEQETMAMAREALDSGASRILEFSLTEDQGYACGGSMTIYLEPRGKMPQLVMFGAGHVGRAVTALAHSCGFRVVVVDDRPDWAVATLLPGAERVVCATVADAFPKLTMDRETSVVIATPGHQHDFAAVRGCLATQAGFIGLLGSRKKRETLHQTLREEGVSDIDIQRVVTPVGMAIGAQTPEEIAVSIVGQLIANRSRA